MKHCISAAFIAVATVVMGFDAESKYIENGRIVLDSPFDLELGSTEYAKTFGSLIRTSAQADYDPITKKTTTNFHHHATAYLSTPYFGCDKVGLKFEDDDKVLSWCYFSIGETTSDNSNIMSYTECRAVLDKIVDDMNKRCGITMQCVGNKTERQAKESVRLKIQDYKRRKEEFLGFNMSFVSFRAQKGSVVYDVHGLINEKERCYISVGCCDFQAISSLSSSYKPGDKIPVHTNKTHSAIGGQVPPFRVENGTIIVSSPFDLEMGSTEYAKIAGKVLRVHRYANYDPNTKKTTTNETAYASAKLAKPYFGCRTISLNFGGKEKRLSSIHMDWERGQTRKGKDSALTNQECRDLVDRILEDMKTHADMTVSASVDRTEEEALERIAEMYKNDGKPKEQHEYHVPFYSWRATRQRNGAPADYWLSAMVGNGKKHRSVSLSAHLPFKIDDHVTVVTNRSSHFSGKLIPTPAQKKAHEEAAKMRAMLKRVFDVDFDATNAVIDLKFTHWSSVTNGPPEKEWLTLETPFEGMTEKKVSKPVSFLCIPFRTFALRRPYDGDVEESELKKQAAQLLARLERELGEKIPSVDNKEAKAELAKRFGEEGVPAFGDTRMVLGLDKVLCFTGKIGDIGIEIAYAAPRYAKSKGAYSIAWRGAVVASFVQSPIFSEEQAKKKAK